MTDREGAACPWIGPASMRHCTLEVVHFHWPLWYSLALQGDWPSRMLLLVWWPSRVKRAA